MRMQSMPAALLGFTMLSVSHLSAASDDPLGGSYAADGACYCLGSLDQSYHYQIEPTPVGGQSVKQICQRLGSGPGLSQSDGLFNHPVYPDTQCGHGPGDVTVGESDDCRGSLDSDAVDCQGVGPRWDLESAYSSIELPTPSVDTVTSDSNELVNPSEPVRVTVKSSLLTAPIVTTATETSADGERLKATIIRSPGTAARVSEKLPDDQTASNTSTTLPVAPAPVTISASSGSLAGRTVVIDGQAYRQARSDMPTTGGAPGSRIILDGFVFLRDDGNLDPTDLYTVPTAQPVERKAIVRKLPEVSEKPVPLASTEATTATESDEIRHQRLLAEARKRLRARQSQENMTTTTESVIPESGDKDTLARETDDTSRTTPLVSDAEEPTVAAANAQVEIDTTVSRQLPVPQELETPASKAVDTDSLASRKSPLDSSKPEEEDAAVAVAKSAESAGKRASGPATLSALRLPPEVRASSRDFDYIDALPTGYDFGGGGMMLEASTDSHGRFHYIGRVGVVSNYQELLVGGGYYLTPQSADRMTVVLTAGLEYGNHEWRDEQTNINAESTDTGFYLGLSSRLVVNRHFELQAGAGYSSFFEGDPVFFGRGNIHINRQLDLVSRIEVGDNDSLGLGIRFYY